MKSVLKVSLLAATVMMAVGCQAEEAQVEKAQVEAAPKVEQAASTITFQSDDEKAAYAIGVSFANYLQASIDKPSELGINLDKALVLKGIEHAFADKAELKEEDVRAALEALDARVAEKMKVEAEAKSAAALKAGEDFRTAFAKEEGVVKTETGLMYKVLAAAEGPKPKDTDTVQVHYKGTLIDGNEFDSSYKRGEPATFPLNRVIPGWTEGVQLMPVGSKFKFVIPPELAYGAQETPSIPGNSTLVFEVELLSIEGEAK